MQEALNGTPILVQEYVRTNLNIDFKHYYLLLKGMNVYVRRRKLLDDFDKTKPLYAVGSMSKTYFYNNLLKNIYLQGANKFIHFVQVKAFS